MTMLTEETDPYVLTPQAAAALLSDAPWRRMVTLGDSVAQGIRERVPGYRDMSWTDRVTEALALIHPDLQAFNLGQRDLVAAEIRSQQLAPALTLRPDFAIVVAGANDMFRSGFDPQQVGGELTTMICALRDAGADVHTVGLMDISSAGLVPEKYREKFAIRLRELAAVTAEICARYGGVHHDLMDYAPSSDPARWSSDRIHLNARGHAAAAAESVRALGAFCSTRAHAPLRSNHGG